MCAVKNDQDFVVEVNRLDLFRAAWGMGFQRVRCLGTERGTDLIDQFETVLEAQLYIQAERGGYKLRAAFNTLQPREQEKITESLTEAFIKIAIEQRLGIPWLVYFDALPFDGLVPANRWRMGLGMTSTGLWQLVRVENGPLPETMLEGRGRIVCVNGQRITTCLVATVRLEADLIGVDLYESTPNENLDLTIPEDIFFNNYYDGIKCLMAAGEVREERVYGIPYWISNLANLPSPEVFEVGLPKRLFEDLMLARSICNVFSELARRKDIVRGTYHCVDQDGVLIGMEGYETTWTEETWGDWFFKIQGNSCYK